MRFIILASLIFTGCTTVIRKEHLEYCDTVCANHQGVMELHCSRIYGLSCLCVDGKEVLQAKEEKKIEVQWDSRVKDGY